MDTPTKYDDVINSRDVIARIDELRDERETLVDAVTEAEEEFEETAGETYADADAETIEADAKLAALESSILDARAYVEEWDRSDEAAELAVLESLAEEGSGSPDWEHGEALIRDSYFTTYAEELADDLGYMQSDRAGTWPFTHIDWEGAARDLQMDYFAVDFDGVDYWIRS